MQLGSFLSGTDAEPCVPDEVEFHVMKKIGTGRTRRLVRAVFLPVSEEERLASRRDAINYLRTLPEYKEHDGVAPPIPSWLIIEEELYKFLQAALHDPDNLACKFVDNTSYPAFRSGIVMAQVEWLLAKYKRYIKEQYPETLTPAEVAQLEEEALGKSEADHGSP